MRMLLTSRYWTTMKVISSKSLFVFLAYLTCCTWAWPVAAPAVYRRTSNANSNYIPFTSNVAYEPADYQLSGDNYNYNSQWDRAKEPLSYYDLLDDYWMNQPASASDIETLSSVAELYDPPAWGKIVKEKPESELEELKAEEREREEEVRQRALEDQYKYNPYGYMGHQAKRAPALKSPVAAAASAPVTTTIQPTTKTSISATTTAKHGAVTFSPKTVRVQQHHQPGMKEVPLLRPPNKAKVAASAEHQENGNTESESEPVIALAQRSVVEKPSAYDTLRKYLSLEDALKKEAEKRRASSSTGRLQKRALTGKNKQIITDVESLGGQLTNLKKSMI